MGTGVLGTKSKPLRSSGAKTRFSDPVRLTGRALRRLVHGWHVKMAMKDGLLLIADALLSVRVSFDN